MTLPTLLACLYKLNVPVPEAQMIIEACRGEGLYAAVIHEIVSFMTDLPWTVVHIPNGLEWKLDRYTVVLRMDDQLFMNILDREESILPRTSSVPQLISVFKHIVITVTNFYYK